MGSCRSQAPSPRRVGDTLGAGLRARGRYLHRLPSVCASGLVVQEWPHTVAGPRRRCTGFPRGGAETRRLPSLRCPRGDPKPADHRQPGANCQRPYRQPQRRQGGEAPSAARDMRGGRGTRPCLGHFQPEIRAVRLRVSEICGLGRCSVDMEMSRLGDAMGPAQVLHVCDSAAGLRGVVVVDNVAAGPSIGGVRMAPDVTTAEVARLARAMTLKNAAAGLAHGGGKGGIVADPRMPAAEKRRLIRSFARLISGLTGYIPGPDMGTDEEAMAHVQDEIGRAVGLPRVLGGIPLDEIGATGWGLAAAARVAAPEAGLDLEGARVAVQGFGAVGIHAARFLREQGARLVAASDSGGAVHNPDGLDLAALIAHKTGDGRPSVGSFAGGAAIDSDALVGVECDIWIPAARPDVLTAGNAPALKARLVLQGANIPATEEAERILHERGVLNVPDFIANAGGVICAAVEYHGGSESQAMQTIADKIERNVREVIDRSRAGSISLRAAALDLARLRVEEAMRYRMR